jgi:mannose-6-phosphate isomerase-like protein (cupin superfamily)
MNVAGRTGNFGPGSAAFVASGDEHDIQNVGTRPAQYFEVILEGNSKTPH